MDRLTLTDEVEIEVSGPRSLVLGPVSYQARVDVTWHHFLTNYCGIKVFNKRFNLLI